MRELSYFNPVPFYKISFFHLQVNSNRPPTPPSPSAAHSLALDKKIGVSPLKRYLPNVKSLMTNK